MTHQIGFAVPATKLRGRGTLPPRVVYTGRPFAPLATRFEAGPPSRTVPMFETAHGDLEPVTVSLVRK